MKGEERHCGEEMEIVEVFVTDSADDLSIKNGTSVIVHLSNVSA